MSQPICVHTQLPIVWPTHSWTTGAGYVLRSRPQHVGVLLQLRSLLAGMTLSLRRRRVHDPCEVERFLDREPAAAHRGSRDLLFRQGRPCLLDEIRARCLLGVVVHDPLLLGVDLGRGGELHGPLRPVLDELSGGEPDEREPNPANAHDIGIGSHRLEEGAARPRRILIPQISPGRLVEDTGLLGAIADRFECGERLPVEVEGLRQGTASRRQGGEATEGKAGTLPVAEALLNLERLAVSGACGVRITRDRVQYALKREGPRLSSHKPGGLAVLEALRCPCES